MNAPDGPLLPSRGYRKLRSYKVAEAVYDATVVFCRRFYVHDRRMTDQMVQAARSGVRNISEGSGAAATSRKTEMKMTNVDCPKCGKAMALRTARKGPNAGKSFWSRTGYPECKGASPA